MADAHPDTAHTDPGLAETALTEEEVLDALAKVAGHMTEGETRAGQADMASAIARSLNSGQHLSVEAGTGVGKSLAYLVPVALSGHRVVIATATKVLQDQLAKKDLPLVSEVLSTEVQEKLQRPLDYTVLKGRNNYVCRLRLHQHDNQPDQLPVWSGEKTSEDKREHADQLRKVLAWSDETEIGDFAELDFEPLPSVWQQVAITSRECPGRQKCQFGDECFAEHARDRAAKADVVVTNQSLYALTVGNLPGDFILPPHDFAVIDEAHQLEDSATKAFSTEITHWRLENLASQATKVSRATGVLSTKDDKKGVKELRVLASSLQEVLGKYVGKRISLAPSADDAGDNAVNNVAEDVAEVLLHLDGLLEKLTLSISNNPGNYSESLTGDRSLLDEIPKSLLNNELSVALTDIRNIADATSEFVVYVDAKYLPDGEIDFPMLCMSPIAVGKLLSKNLWADRAAILTSATLPLPLTCKLGLPDPDSADPGYRKHEHLQVASPFDYANNALLYCAKHLPEPNNSDFREAAVAVMLDLINAAGGRALSLFTSWSALKETASALEAQLDGSIRVLRQGGEHTNAQLLDALIEDPATVICATKSFWQGVDIPGQALSLVTIDRVPFAAPNDPVVGARFDAAKTAGLNAFASVQVSSAATLFAQGIGRLIRTATDRGVVAVLDSRLVAKWPESTKRQLLESVPPMKRSIELSEAVDHLRRCRKD